MARGSGQVKAEGTKRFARWYRHRNALEEQRQEAAGAVLPVVEAVEAGSLEEEYERRCREDPRWFIEEHLSCRHIEGKRLVPMVLKPGQVKIQEAMDKQRAAKQPIRVVALKNRKHGTSTFGLALGYGYASTRTYVNVALMAHKDELTGEFLQTVNDFYYTDRRRELGLWPATQKSNRKELLFGNPDPRSRGENPGLRSSIRIMSAEAMEPGMGSTLHFLLASEAARWTNPGVTRAAFNAMSNDLDSVILMESTGFGIGGVFYETCQKAMAGESEFSFVFLSWMEDERLRLELTPEERAKWDWRTQEERDYAERWGLSLEQAKWRRRQLASPAMFVPGQTPEEVFDQEYPASPELAFIGTGRNFFLIPSLVKHRRGPRGERAPERRCEIDSKIPLEQRNMQNRFKVEVTLHDHSYGPLLIWKPPVAGHEYIVGGDCAKGVSQGDNHTLAVLDRAELDFVCTWKGNHVSTRRFGQIAALVGWWYNTAVLALENNHYGLAAVEEAKRILYPRQWYHVDVQREGLDAADRIGWMTTEASRAYMLTYVEHEIREGPIGIHDRDFYEEALVFVRNESGKPVAMVGKHDDHIISHAIALAVHVQSAPMRPEKPAKVMSGRLVPDFGAGRIERLPLRMRRVRQNDPWSRGR